MCWLHCFLDDRYQMLAQLVEIDLITQCRAESCESLGSVIFAAVEAAVDERLDAPSQGLKEGSNGERRSNNDDGRLCFLPGEQTYKRLQTDHQAKVDQGEQGRQRAID